MTYHNHVTIRCAVSKNGVLEQVILFHFVDLECLPRGISPILEQHQPRMDMLIQLPLDKILISTLFHLNKFNISKICLIFSRHTFFLDNSTITNDASSLTNYIIRVSFTFWNKLIFLSLKISFNFHHREFFFLNFMHSESILN